MLVTTWAPSINSPWPVYAPPITSSQPKAETSSMIYQATLRYRIVQMLGGGGFGLVHKAKDARLHRCVALRYPPWRRFRKNRRRSFDARRWRLDSEPLEPESRWREHSAWIWPRVRAVSHCKRNQLRVRNPNQHAPESSTRGRRFDSSACLRRWRCRAGR